MQDVTGRRNHPQISQGTVYVPSPGLKIEYEAEKRRANAEQIAAWEALIHKGHDEVIDIYGAVYNPSVLVVYNVVSWIVPPGCVAFINKYSLIFSEPWMARMQTWTWAITVNGERVANTGEQGGGNNVAGMGEIVQPLEIEPVWIQSGDNISLTMYPNLVYDNETESYTVQGRLSGKIYKPASPVIRKGL